MARCDCCGNDYDKAFVVEMDGKRYTFDSFECSAPARSDLSPVWMSRTRTRRGRRGSHLLLRALRRR